MAARPLTAVRTGSRTPRAAALVVLAALCLAPAAPAPAAPEQKKVWDALTEQERRGRRPAAVPRAPAAARGAPAAFPSGALLVLVAGGLVAAVLAIGALRARRRSAALPEPAEPAGAPQGSTLENLWRSHLRRKSAKRDAAV